MEKYRIKKIKNAFFSSYIVEKLVIETNGFIFKTTSKERVGVQSNGYEAFSLFGQFGPAIIRKPAEFDFLYQARKFKKQLENGEIGEHIIN